VGVSEAVAEREPAIEILSEAKDPFSDPILLSPF
jgi:hypothetical protein